MLKPIFYQTYRKALKYELTVVHFWKTLFYIRYSAMRSPFSDGVLVIFLFSKKLGIISLLNGGYAALLNFPNLLKIEIPMHSDCYELFLRNKTPQNMKCKSKLFEDSTSWKTTLISSDELERKIFGQFHHGSFLNLTIGRRSVLLIYIGCHTGSLILWHLFVQDMVIFKWNMSSLLGSLYSKCSEYYVRYRALVFSDLLSFS